VQALKVNIRVHQKAEKVPAFFLVASWLVAGVAAKRMASEQ
jgi:hypothetical protein